MNRLLKLALVLALCVPALASAQFRQSGGFVSIGTSLPATCSVGQITFKSDATAGQNIYMCTATNTWTQQLNSGAGGASIALDNLVGANINLALTPQTGIDLGSTTKQFRNIYLFGTGTYGTNYHLITGASTSGARTITLPDASGTVALTNATTLSSLVSVGTINTGVWQGTAIDNTRGGTGSAFFNVAGPAGSVKTFTFPNASANVLTDNALVTTAQGGTGLGAQSDDTMLISNGTIWQAKAIPDCQDTGGNHLNYTASTNALSCGTSGGAGGGVTAASNFGTDNLLIRSDGTLKGVQSSGITIDDSNNVTGMANLELATGKYLGTAHSAGNTMLIGAWDVDGAAFTAFITCTANNTPTCDMATGLTLGGNPVAQFTDPNVDCILYWRDSDGSIQCVTVSTGLNLTAGTLTATGLTTASIDTSAELYTIVADRTGSGGALVFATAPTITSPVFITKMNWPRVTAFPGSPSAGDVVIVTDDSVIGACDSAAGAARSLCFWNGSAWVSLGDGTSAGGTVSISGTPSSGQAAEWVSASAIQGVAVTGTGNYVKATSPTLTTPVFASFVTGGNTITPPAAATTLVGRDTTDVLTGKTLDASAAGNVVKLTGVINLSHPFYCDGTGAVIQTTATTDTYGEAVFSNSADQAANYCEYLTPVPFDIDTSVAMTARWMFKLGGADTGTHRYVISMADVNTSAVVGSASLTNAINLDFAGDGSGANGDLEAVGFSTLTSWAAALTANHMLRIRVARDGDATQDNSTVNSSVYNLTIQYGVTQ